MMAKISLFLEGNSVFFQIVIALFTITLGIVTLIVGINKYIKQKQIDAMSSFYINLLIYLERLQMFLEHPSIKRLFFDEKTRVELVEKLGEESTEQYAKAISYPFIAFCREFIRYISTADNNVSPVKKYTPGKWETWYKNILILTQFLHDGQMINKINKYTSKDQYNEFEAYYERVKAAIRKIQKSIKKKLKIKKA
jgi:hypothetical protein